MRPSPWLWLPVVLAAGAVLLPLLHLLVRAVEGGEAWGTPGYLPLLGRTLLLAAAVLAADVLLALPLAWLVVRTALPGRGWLAVLLVLPLALPGYALAYGLLAATGPAGVLAEVFGWAPPRPSGFVGAWIALVAYTYPYLFLNLKAALGALDPRLEEAAGSLGHGPAARFFRVVLPALKPALFGGGAIVLLHVLADFGVVSLMRYETFSYAIYLQYAALYDQERAAALALWLLGLALLVLTLEGRWLNPNRPGRTGPPAPLAPLGRLGPPAFLAVAAVPLFALALPLLPAGYWAAKLAADWVVADLPRALGQSLSVALPAALLSVAAATPLAVLTARHPGALARLAARLAYLGYASPPLAFGLGYVYLSLSYLPQLYQTLPLLILVYAVHFLAEALGPLRARMLALPPRLEEAARGLGAGRLEVLLRIRWPLIRPGLLAGGLIVFLGAMKELPLAFLLAPLGFESLALAAFDYTEEANYPYAAPFVLLLALVGLGSAALIPQLEKQR
ncbi:ABC transporter permease [Oceanithermus profundus]